MKGSGGMVLFNITCRALALIMMVLSMLRPENTVQYLVLAVIWLQVAEIND